MGLEHFSQNFEAFCQRFQIQVGHEAQGYLRDYQELLKKILDPSIESSHSASDFTRLKHLSLLVIQSLGLFSKKSFFHSQIEVYEKLLNDELYKLPQSVDFQLIENWLNPGGVDREGLAEPLVQQGLKFHPEQLTEDMAMIETLDQPLGLLPQGTEYSLATLPSLLEIAYGKEMGGLMSIWQRPLALSRQAKQWEKAPSLLAAHRAEYAELLSWKLHVFYDSQGQHSNLEHHFLRILKIKGVVDEDLKTVEACLKSNPAEHFTFTSLQQALNVVITQGTVSTRQQLISFLVKGVSSPFFSPSIPIIPVAQIRFWKFDQRKSAQINFDCLSRSFFCESLYQGLCGLKRALKKQSIFTPLPYLQKVQEGMQQGGEIAACLSGPLAQDMKSLKSWGVRIFLPQSYSLLLTRMKDRLCIIQHVLLLQKEIFQEAQVRFVPWLQDERHQWLNLQCKAHTVEIWKEILREAKEQNDAFSDFLKTVRLIYHGKTEVQMTGIEKEIKILIETLMPLFKQQQEWLTLSDTQIVQSFTQWQEHKKSHSGGGMGMLLSPKDPGPGTSVAEASAAGEVVLSDSTETVLSVLCQGQLIDSINLTLLCSTDFKNLPQLMSQREKNHQILRRQIEQVIVQIHDRGMLVEEHHHWLNQVIQYEQSLPNEQLLEELRRSLKALSLASSGQENLNRLVAQIGWLGSDWEEWFKVWNQTIHEKLQQTEERFARCMAETKEQLLQSKCDLPILSLMARMHQSVLEKFSSHPNSFFSAKGLLQSGAKEIQDIEPLIRAKYSECFESYERTMEALQQNVLWIERASHYDAFFKEYQKRRTVGRRILASEIVQGIERKNLGFMLQDKTCGRAFPRVYLS